MFERHAFYLHLAITSRSISRRNEILDCIVWTKMHKNCYIFSTGMKGKRLTCLQCIEISTCKCNAYKFHANINWHLWTLFLPTLNINQHFGKSQPVQWFLQHNKLLKCGWKWKSNVRFMYTISSPRIAYISYTQYIRIVTLVKNIFFIIVTFLQIINWHRMHGILHRLSFVVIKFHFQI